MSQNDQMQKDYRAQLDNAMLLLQALLDEQFEDNEDIQNAFNALACALDYYIED
jgi:hypothetical protein